MFIKNVKIINHNETIENANIEIEDGKIKNIIEKPGVGKTIIIPGFIDIHIHGFHGDDFTDSIESTEFISKNILKYGVTSIMPTLITRSIPMLHHFLQDISASKPTGANIIGIHMEGPFISKIKKGAHNEEYIIQGDVQILENLQSAAKGFIKKMTFAPEECSDDFIKKMFELNIIPTIGHTNATYNRIQEVSKFGKMHATHLWNAMSGIENRKPGAVEAIFLNPNIYPELISDLIHVDKETLEFTYKLIPSDRLFVITDSIRPAGLEDGESESGGQMIVKNGSKITLKGTDTIAGSGSTMYDNFKNIINLFGDINTAVKITSFNQARELSLNKGVIKNNFDADLVELDKDLNIKNVYIRGEKI